MRLESDANAFVRAFELTFPHRVRGYYLHGSAADESSLDTSDLDVDVVVRGEFHGSHERDAMRREADRIVSGISSALDVDILDEVSLANGAEPAFKLASRLLYGEDIREDVPLIPIESWGRERMYRAYFLMVRVFNRPTPVRRPLDFPDASDKFYGYTRRTLRLPDGGEVPSTRDLIRVSGWLATALVAYEGKQHVARKRDLHPLYRSCFDDEWAPLIEDMYFRCRTQWRCLIPSHPEDREVLRAICSRTLEFENRFLTRFIPFLEGELIAGAPGPENRARWLMQNVPLDGFDSG